MGVTDDRGKTEAESLLDKLQGGCASETGERHCRVLRKAAIMDGMSGGFSVSMQRNSRQLELTVVSNILALRQPQFCPEEKWLKNGSPSSTSIHKMVFGCHK